MAIGICVICGKGFIATKKNLLSGRRKTCSLQCVSKYRKTHTFFSNEHRKKISLGNKGKKHSEEWSRNISNFLKGHIGYGIGLKRPLEIGRKISLAKIGKKRKPFSDIARYRMSLARRGNKNNMFGKTKEKCPNWKGGITPFRKALRTLLEYSNWVRNVFEKDGFTCQECNKKGDLEAHHIKHMNYIVNDFLKQYAQFSVVDDKETLLRLATTYEPFWDVNNGKTLCRKCHREKIHQFKFKQKYIV